MRCVRIADPLWWPIKVGAYVVGRLPRPMPWREAAAQSGTTSIGQIAKGSAPDFVPASWRRAAALWNGPRSGHGGTRWYSERCYAVLLLEAACRSRTAPLVSGSPVEPFVGPVRRPGRHRRRSVRPAAAARLPERDLPLERQADYVVVAESARHFRARPPARAPKPRPNLQEGPVRGHDRPSLPRGDGGLRRGAGRGQLDYAGVRGGVHGAARARP